MVNTKSGRETANLGSSSRRAEAKSAAAVESTGASKRSERNREESHEEDGRRADVVGAGEELGMAEWLVGTFVPAAKDVFLLIVTSMLNVSKVVFSAVMAFLRFLRDALFEQVEEDEDDE